MASQWAAHLCLSQGSGCQWLGLHRRLATPAALSVLMLVASGWLFSPWCRRHWGLPAASGVLVLSQMALGVATLRHALTVPALTIAHQLVACLLVAVLAALAARARPSVRPEAPLTAAEPAAAAAESLPPALIPHG
ncbi:hypothetical protein [Synechococcus sp. RSCCF101]|uniref:hypothetical protein n=1 Tax=Synechococcus sp. RSCCF101 TaxID=2511069 RepID=UPI003519EB4E